jgi:hypothetical protein
MRSTPQRTWPKYAVKGRGKRMWSKGIVQRCGQKTWSKDMGKTIRVRAVRLMPSRGANPSNYRTTSPSEPLSLALPRQSSGQKTGSKSMVKDVVKGRGQRTWPQLGPKGLGASLCMQPSPGQAWISGRFSARLCCKSPSRAGAFSAFFSLRPLTTPSRPASLRCGVPTGCLCNRSTASVLRHFQSPNPPISSLHSVVQSVHEAQPALCTCKVHLISAQMPAQMPACFPRCLLSPSLSLRLWTVSVVRLSFRASTFHK